MGWCKKCFKCSVCNKILNLDTYMSHEGIIYCKPHHKELFMPKTVRSDIIDVGNVSKQQEAVLKHQEAQRNHETIIRESNPVQRDDVIKSSTCTKWSGMEDLDVGSKFKKFEAASTEDDLPAYHIVDCRIFGPWDPRLLAVKNNSCHFRYLYYLLILCIKIKLFAISLTSDNKHVVLLLFRRSRGTGLNIKIGIAQKVYEL